MRYEIAVETERPIQSTEGLVKAVEWFMDDEAGFLDEFYTIELDVQPDDGWRHDVAMLGGDPTL